MLVRLNGASRFVTARHPSYPRRKVGLSGRRIALFDLLDGGFCPDEAYLGVLAVAKRFVQAAAAAAKRERGLASEIILIASRVNQFDGSFSGFDAIGAIGSYCDFHLSHSLCPFSREL